MNIDVVSRFRTSTQMKETLRRVENGGVDILIGTHRLFNKDVKFKDLGLLVVDEEQRFGVQHKEKLKETFRQVDVLTLSATPIPRTLNMAMSGIRDMSPWKSPPPTGCRSRPTCWSTTGRWWPTPCAGSWSGAARCTTSTTGWRPSTAPPPAFQQMLGEDAAVGVAHGKMSQEPLMT